jgi:ribonuclease P protein component
VLWDNIYLEEELSFKDIDFDYLCSMDEKFGKEYKLCSKAIIQSIFEEKKSVKQFPLTLFYHKNELPSSKKFQVVISVPKRIFKKAHDRNRIKRLLKEVFRKNKLILEKELATKDYQLALFLLYNDKIELEYVQLLEKMNLLLNKLIKELKIKKYD